MKQLECNVCQTVSAEGAFYCSNCGNQLKCKSCGEILVEEAKHCIACGAPVLNIKNESQNRLLNSIKLKENKEERLYEIEFTNEVGKEIKEVVIDILKNKLSTISADKLLVSDKSSETINLKGQLDILSGNEQEQDFEEIEDDQLAYPHLNDLEINLDCRENEWLLIYAFYLSDYGTTTFSKDKVWQLYKEKRKTETRFKNLGTNWKSLFKKYISTVKENEFRFTTVGLIKVKALVLQQNSDTKKAKITPKATGINWEGMAPNRNIVSRKVAATPIKQEEFDFHGSASKESLESFFIRKRPGNGNPNRIITIAYYITKINKQEYFTEGNIDFAYRALNLSGKPVHLRQVIINLKNDRLWFQRVNEGNKNAWKLTRQAEIYVEERLPQFF